MKINPQDQNQFKNNHIHSTTRMPMKRLYLTSEAILRYLIGNDEDLNTLIICKHTQFSLETDDHAIYESMGSIKEQDDFKLNKLVKLFEVVKIHSGKRQGILTEERVELIRKEALRKKDDSNKNNAKK
ncbi:hypothetical protein HN587_03960 [Candidatus Woesearchaeota archaeon]|jgi:hypothetical protein|nr:hypothetical protein [Candidatus Woesearchaeota archaeon]